MRKKRNITESNDDNSKPSKKISSPQALKQEKKIDGKQQSNITDKAVKSNQEGMKFGLSISIDRDILYNEDEEFFDLFEDYKNITLGRHFIVTYESEKEVQAKLKDLQKKSYQGIPLKVKYRKMFESKMQKRGKLSSQTDLSKLILRKIPITATQEELQKNFPDAVRIIRRKKKGKAPFRTIIIEYSEKSQAEQDLKRSENILIDGEKIEAFIPDANGSVPNSPKMGKKANTPAEKKQKKENDTEESVTSSPDTEGTPKKQQKKRKLSKSSE